MNHRSPAVPLSMAAAQNASLIIYSLVNCSFSYRFTTPTEALSFKSFDQIAFIQGVNTVIGKEILNPTGMCYGYLTVSFAYSCLGFDDQFDKCLQSIREAKEYTVEQMELITTLANSQDTNAEQMTGVQIGEHVVIVTKTKGLTKINIPNDHRFQDSIKQCAEEAIEMAVSNFGDRIGIIVNDEVISHVIGITAKRDGDKVLLQYDDPNYFIKVQFDNFTDAHTDIIKLLTHGYQKYYFSVFAKKKDATIYLVSYEAECDGTSFSTSVGREWAKQNRNSFFSKTKRMSANASFYVKPESKMLSA